MAELIWDGKYEANGRRVARLTIALTLPRRSKPLTSPPRIASASSTSSPVKKKIDVQTAVEVVT